MKNETKQKATPVTLVRNGRLLYPKTDEDYAVLKQLKLPVNQIDQDFLPLLETVKKLHKINFTIQNFGDLEQHMFQVAQSEWPFDISVSPSSMMLKAPKNVKQERLDKFINKIRLWYRKHNLIVEPVYKRTSKSIKVVLSKRINLDT